MYNNPINYMAGNDLIKVKGFENVKFYPTKPNSRECVFDADEDVFYIVTTDANNFKTSIRRFRFTEEPIESVYDSKYATKEDLNSLKEMIGNVQQSIQQLSESDNRTKSNNKPNGNKQDKALN